MFCSNVYDYVNVLGTALDATATRNEIISNNIANVNTPEYKRKDIRFETELKHAFAHSDKKTVDARVRHLELGALEPEVYTGGGTGTISYELKGNMGRWHDFFFIPDGEEKTLSELREIDYEKEATYWGDAKDQFAKWYIEKNNL